MIPFRLIFTSRGREIKTSNRSDFHWLLLYRFYRWNVHVQQDKELQNMITELSTKVLHLVLMKRVLVTAGSDKGPTLF